MALPSAAPTRQLVHRRAIDIAVYLRDDALWEVDARLTDVKTRDTPLATGVRPAGEPIHDLLLRLVVDGRFNVVEAGARSDRVPYPGQCDDHGDSFDRLVGLNLLRGFRAAVDERLGGVLSCTHLTELSRMLPTAVVQAFAGRVLDTRGQGDVQPFQIDRCRVLRSDGPIVRAHHPRWYRPPGVAAPAPGGDILSAAAGAFPSLPRKDTP